MIPKLSRACDAIRAMVHISNIPTVGRFSLYKKKIVRIMASAQPRTSRRSLSI